MKTTLVLNADAQPLDFIPLSTIFWEEAVTLLLKNSVSVVYYYDMWYVRSPSEKIQLPSVVMLEEFKKPEKMIQFNRWNVYLRDGFKCQYTGKDYFYKQSELTLDHVHPKSKGGKTDWNNVVTCSKEANIRKGNNEKITPFFKPKRPNYWELVTQKKKFPIKIPDIRWNEFLRWDKSLVEIYEVENPFKDNRR